MVRRLNRKSWLKRYFFERTGFEVVDEYSDFFRSPPAYGKEQVWALRKI
jgi:hypothetical protein